jgi:hypothetical protein
LLPASCFLLPASYFQLLWRLAILSLPWQTRWFADASLAGWPWEQGRLSFYISWLLIIATIIFAFCIRKKNTASLSRLFSFKNIVLVSALVIISLIGTGLDVRALRAAGQWWLQVAVLTAFAISLYQAGVERRKLAAWFVISLLPHVALGYWQYAVQKVYGFAWLGIALQDPTYAGVAVVEHGLFRVLRIYGGFPHPNIFGGWAAVGLIVSLFLAATAETKPRVIGWSFMSAALSVTLLLTYARSAWLAAFLGVGVLAAVAVIQAVRHRPSPISGQYLGLALTAALMLTTAVAYTQYDHVFARFDTSLRLERQSVDARAQSLAGGWETFKLHLLVGTGPNASLLDLAGRLKKPTSPAPLEPAHSVPLLALAEVGILGAVCLILLIWPLFRLFRRFDKTGLSLALAAALVPLALFDHYLWSLWAGQTLAVLVLLIIWSRPRLD